MPVAKCASFTTVTDDLSLYIQKQCLYRRIVKRVSVISEEQRG